MSDKPASPARGRKKTAPPAQQPPQEEVVVRLPLADLYPFPDHPFQVRDDEEMRETIQSVKEYGVIVPAIVRPREEGGYEIVAGHRRKYACEQAGLDTMPVLIRKGDPKEAVNVANLIVSDPTVIAGMGSFSSSCAMAAAPVFEEADLLLFSPNASHTDFPAMGENMFSAVMSQKYEGAEFADALIEMFGAQNVAILYQNTDHGVIATDVFTKQYEAGGGKVIMSETFIPGQTKDFSPVLSRIKEQDPDLFYVNASYNDCAQIFMQAKALNMDCQLVGPGMLLTEEFLDVVGNKIDGTIVMSSVPAFLPSVLESGELDAASKNFVDSYTAEYNEVPDGFAASAFDAVNIVLDAVAKVGTDTPALREELKTLRDYPGVSGYNMSFNEQKEMVKGIYLFEIQDGQFVRVK